jgi:murein lipoprotein
MEIDIMALKLKPLCILSAVAILGGVTGCASTSDLDALRADVERANEAASRAASDAAEARREAADAKALAQEANTTATETSEKMDRMFKKSMYK